MKALLTSIRILLITAVLFIFLYPLTISSSYFAFLIPLNLLAVGL